MTGVEKGFLLLTARMGDPKRNVLTTVQFRVLAERMRHLEKPTEDRELSQKDLAGLGYGTEMARRILELLSQEELLHYYCIRGQRMGCVPITRATEGYPDKLRQKLGLDAPGCLWAKGDLSLLGYPAIALVGSRDLNEENRVFAETVGRMAAERGWVLVSGNARGADRTAQDACRKAGGKVISVVADELAKQPAMRDVLYISEDGYDEPFSRGRALSRNRCIHALGQVTFVAQSTLRRGGTWDGTAKNLRCGWSTVACFRDGSQAAAELEQMGAFQLNLEDLGEFLPVSLQESLF